GATSRRASASFAWARTGRRCWCACSTNRCSRSATRRSRPVAEASCVMATRATIHRAELAIADMDRGYYADHTLTIARHPSETVEIMMLRRLAFAFFADPALQFGRGLSTMDEPDLWQHDDAGQLLRWIDVGLPDERRLRKACG